MRVAFKPAVGVRIRDCLLDRPIVRDRRFPCQITVSDRYCAHSNVGRLGQVRPTRFGVAARSYEALATPVLTAATPEPKQHLVS